MKKLVPLFMTWLVAHSCFSQSSLPHDGRYHAGPLGAYFIIKVVDYEGHNLVNEWVELTSLEMKDEQREFRTDGAGEFHFTGNIGATYDLHFELDKYYAQLLVTHDPGFEPWRIDIKYEGTEKIKLLRKERAALEKAAVADWEKWASESGEARLRGVLESPQQEPDSTVMAVLNRNDQWEDRLIVTDVTGSMYKYTDQVLLWYSLNFTDNPETNLTFFNDGDLKSTEEKEIGATGGLYHCAQCGVDKMLEKMAIAMASGGGGDGPENDVEAVLEGAKLFPKSKEVILIADNGVPARDMSLLGEVSVPVHVVLCHGFGRVHPDYLRIALETGGSLHTIEQDIENLAEIKEGETLQIGEHYYLLKDGVFQPFHKY